MRRISDGFGLIVLLMRRGDEVRAGLLPNLTQPREAHLASRRFDAAMLDRLGVERAVRDMELDRMPFAEIADERFVVIRFGAAKMVIDVPGDELPPFRAQLCQGEEQRRRIGAA